MFINNTIDSATLSNLLNSANAPLLIDVRRSQILEESNDIIPSAYWSHHLLVEDLFNGIDASFSKNRDVVVYCAHGHQLSLLSVSILRNLGINAVALVGGIEEWNILKLPLLDLNQWRTYATKSWMTKERPSIDGLACAWFIRRFINETATIHYLEEEWIVDAAIETESIIFDINKSDTIFCNTKELCTLNSFIKQFSIETESLSLFAKIIDAVNKSNTAPSNNAITPQAAGLFAIYQGLLQLNKDDLTLQQQSFVMFDALYQWCSLINVKRD